MYRTLSALFIVISLLYVFLLSSIIAIDVFYLHQPHLVHERQVEPMARLAVAYIVTFTVALQEKNACPHGGHCMPKQLCALSIECRW